MPRRALVVVLVVAVVCGALGTGLLGLFQPADLRWTAAAHLRLVSDGATYLPVDPTWLAWRPRLGAALLALEVGTTGATLVVLLAGRRTR